MLVIQIHMNYVKHTWDNTSPQVQVLRVTSLYVWNQTEAWGRRGGGGGKGGGGGALHSFQQIKPHFNPSMKVHKHHCSFDSIVLSRLHLARQ